MKLLNILLYMEIYLLWNVSQKYVNIILHIGLTFLTKHGYSLEGTLTLPTFGLQHLNINRVTCKACIFFKLMFIMKDNRKQIQRYQKGIWIYARGGAGFAPQY